MTDKFQRRPLDAPMLRRPTAEHPLSLSQIVMEGHVAAAVEGMAKTPARPPGGRVRRIAWSCHR